VVVAARVFLGQRVNLQEKYDYPQLQRLLRQITGFSPHDLLKVLRLQQSFRRHYLDLYADQSHFTTAFRRAIGYTPGHYRKAFGVRFPQDGMEADD
jgi:AraC-like DNA-binding protein